MEYPFKDLQPLDEVTARTGYYKDWTHIDADTFHQISELVKFIRAKGYGVDTRESIAQALERVYHDAAKSGNANMEVSMARRGYSTLAESLGNISVNMINKNLGKLDQTFMSDEFLQQMAGDTPVNAVPADGSLETEKYANNSVTPVKTDFFDNKEVAVTSTKVLGARSATDPTVRPDERGVLAYFNTEVGKKYRVEVSGTINQNRFQLYTVPVSYSPSGTNTIVDTIVVNNSLKSYTFTSEEGLPVAGYFSNIGQLSDVNVSVFEVEHTFDFKYNKITKKGTELTHWTIRGAHINGGTFGSGDDNRVLSGAIKVEDGVIFESLNPDIEFRTYVYDANDNLVSTDHTYKQRQQIKISSAEYAYLVCRFKDDSVIDDANSVADSINLVKNTHTEDILNVNVLRTIQNEVVSYEKSSVKFELGSFGTTGHPNEGEVISATNRVISEPITLDGFDYISYDKTANADIEYKLMFNVDGVYLAAESEQTTYGRNELIPSTIGEIRIVAKYNDDRNISDVGRIANLFKLHKSMNFAEKSLGEEKLKLHPVVELGSLSSDNGHAVTSPIRMRSTDFYDLAEGDVVALRSSNLMYRLIEYDADKNFITMHPYQTNNFIVSRDMKVKFVLSYSDSREITDIDYFNGALEVSVTRDKIEALKKEIDLVKSQSGARKIYARPLKEIFKTQSLSETNLPISDLNHWQGLWDGLVSSEPLRSTKKLIGHSDTTQSEIYSYTFRPLQYPEITSMVNPDAEYILGGTKTPKIIIVGGVHGNEQWAMHSLYSFFDQMMTGNDPLLAYIRDAVEFVVVPLFNAEGVSKSARLDDSGKDLNRNYPNSPSQNDLDAVVAENSDASYFIDLHNAWSNMTTVDDLAQHVVGYLATDSDLLKNMNVGVVKSLSRHWESKYPEVKLKAEQYETTHSKPYPYTYSTVEVPTTISQGVRHLHGIPSVIVELNADNIFGSNEKNSTLIGEMGTEYIGNLIVSMVNSILE